MMDLTQKLLELDGESIKALHSAEVTGMKLKKEADLRSEQKMEEARQLFEKQKKDDLERLSKMLDGGREKAAEALHKKMAFFRENVNIDQLVEHLLKEAKDRICR